MFITIEEIISRLKISRTTLHTMRREGNFIKPVRIGRSVRFSEADFQNWIAQNMGQR